ncbi:MAG: Bax inhibitor-1/YccA family protein [Bacteroidales bacterium]|nr:Bax inhibitor-1/YccA family protein [Bacteroidales bacterium]
MRIGRSANPALNRNTFVNVAHAETSDEVMTLNGTVNKTLIMLLLVMGAAAYTWNLFFKSIDPETGAVAGTVNGWMIGGGIGGFIAALVTIFKKTWAPYSAPVYALLEGLFLGAISAYFNAQFPGIVFNAVLLTFGILFFLLFLYKSRIIKPTENFKLGVFAATGGIFFVYLISWVLRLFGVSVGFIHDSGPIGIGFSLVVVVIASLNLVLDFDFIEQGAEQGAPKYMEWYAAFGLIVTLVWLYLELLRLLAKLSSRR